MGPHMILSTKEKILYDTILAISILFLESEKSQKGTRMKKHFKKHLTEVLMKH